MNIPENLKYTETHEWLMTMPDGSVRVGITDFAQHALSDVVFVDLPEAGDAVTAGEAFCDVESVKAVEGVMSPVTGEISAINDELTDAPQLVNEKPYDSWMIEVTGVTATSDLMDAAAYALLCKED